MAKQEVYTFQKDLSLLRTCIANLETDLTPIATERNCNRIKSILDRILENRNGAYIPYDVKQYFADGE